MRYVGDYFHPEADQRELIRAWAAQVTARLEHILEDGLGDGSIAPCETRLVSIRRSAC